MKNCKFLIFALIFALTLSLTACGAAPGQPGEIKSEQPEEAPVEQLEDTEPEIDEAYFVDLQFRTEKQLNEHYEKHGKDMGFLNADEYEHAANLVINDPDVLHKIEKEDGDDVYYLEETNEFVVVSTDGYIRTYFWPDAGKKYYDKQ